MNKIIIASLCAVVLFAFACRTQCHIELEKPADIKPIDWEGYNDVYTVFWNILTDDCRGAGTTTGDTIMVYGKLDTITHNRHRFFALTYEQRYEQNSIYDIMHEYNHYRGPSVYVSFFVTSDEVQEKLDTCDLTKRCYIKGELATGMVGGEMPADYCCFAFPQVHLKNMDNIYFEE